MFSDDSVRLQTGAITICAVNCEVLHSPSQMWWCPQLHQGLSINCYSWDESLLRFDLVHKFGLYITLKEGSRIAACVKNIPLRMIICEQADNKVSDALGQGQLISERIINCSPP